MKVLSEGFRCFNISDYDMVFDFYRLRFVFGLLCITLGAKIYTYFLQFWLF